MDLQFIANLALDAPPVRMMALPWPVNNLYDFNVRICYYWHSILNHNEVILLQRLSESGW